MTNITVVVGGQYGSEAKGAVTAHLAGGLSHRDVVVRVAGPNAGHTAYSPGGREWKLRCIPAAAVVNDHCQLHLAAGSEIDLGVLVREINDLEEAGIPVTDRLTIHPSATILEVRHHGIEANAALMERIGSTGKGIGAARADRIMRSASTVEQRAHLFKGMHLSESGPFDLSGVNELIIEGTQGYGLGLHTGHYPQVTSSDCRAIDFLAMAGISPWHDRVGSLHIVVVARCFPIRVAGNSGPLNEETTWAELGLPEERTTVTNKVRRVGHWDSALLSEAIAANGGGSWNEQVSLAITMVDQKFPECTGVKGPRYLSQQARAWLSEVEDEHECEIRHVGTSPTTMFPITL